MAFDNIELKLDGLVAVLMLDRPDQMNPLDWATVKELAAAFGQLEADATARVVLISGRGKAFSAGGDLKAYMELYRKPAEFRAFLDDFRRLNSAIESSSMVVIAAVNGFCVAGGLELMLACDLALAADHARIGDGHLNYGQLPGAGAPSACPGPSVRRARATSFTVAAWWAGRKPSVSAWWPAQCRAPN